MKSVVRRLIITLIRERKLMKEVKVKKKTKCKRIHKYGSG